MEDLDARSDLYALGAILYQILALRPPVTGRTAMEIVDKVGRGEIEPLDGGTRPPGALSKRGAAGVTSRGDERARSACFTHLPDGHIPRFPRRRAHGRRGPRGTKAIVEGKRAEREAAVNDPANRLGASNNRLKDLSTLIGLPLLSLNVAKAPIADFTPLLRIPTLESLETFASIERLLPLRAHPGLKQIKLGDAPFRPVAEIWAEFDAQQAAGKK